MQARAARVVDQARTPSPARSTSSAPPDGLDQGRKRVRTEFRSPSTARPLSTAPQPSLVTPLPAACCLFAEVARAARTPDKSEAQPPLPFRKVLGPVLYQSSSYLASSLRFPKLDGMVAYIHIPHVQWGNAPFLHDLLQSLPLAVGVEFFPDLSLMAAFFANGADLDRATSQPQSPRPGSPLDGSFMYRFLTPSPDRPKYTYLSLDRVPIKAAERVTDTIRTTLSKFGTVHQIRPRVWSGTNLLSFSWQVIMTLTSEPPAVLENIVIIEREGVRNVCRYCLDVNHTKPDCRQARSAADRKAAKETARREQNTRHKQARRARKAAAAAGSTITPTDAAKPSAVVVASATTPVGGSSHLTSPVPPSPASSVLGVPSLPNSPLPRSSSSGDPVRSLVDASGRPPDQEGRDSSMDLYH